MLWCRPPGASSLGLLGMIEHYQKKDRGVKILELISLELRKKTSEGTSGEI
jgi:hypothetical protein